MLAAAAPADTRAEFIRKTYSHLAGAILAFAGLCTLIVKTPAIYEPLMRLMLGTQFSWLVVLGLFMGVGWIANKWAQSDSSTTLQYVGLGLYVVAEAVIFTPLLVIAAYYTSGNVLPTAAIMTLAVFGGLTVLAFVTKKDFSFLGRALTLGGFAALGLVVVSLVVGFDLGTWFSVAMVVLASGYILYYTSNIIHHYRIGSHVAAALALFAAVALLFYYILRLVASRR
ncbi:MAG: Bax inhibitor-1/YccA family protein [Myxococcales bacterium]|nr:Bax inhibitor-1/YccA family protein [Myxococcales bacterium]